MKRLQITIPTIIATDDYDYDGKMTHLLLAEDDAALKIVADLNQENDSIKVHTLDMTSTFEDIDGNIYKTVVIGAQRWMAENLKTTRYADGSAITYVKDNSEWAALEENVKAYCWYENSTEN